VLPHEFVAATIIGRAFMVTSVDLHNQPFAATQEVGEIGTDGKLPDKPVAAEPSRLQFEP
jgi:hypothetical protein